MPKKLIEFNTELNDDIQEFADKFLGGNFSAAVKFLSRFTLDKFPTNQIEAFNKESKES